MVHTQVQGTSWQPAGCLRPGKDTSRIRETHVSGVRRLKAGPRGEPSHGRRRVHGWRNLKVWVQSLRSYTGSTQGHSSWTGSSGACSSWTGSRMIHSLRSSNRAYSNCTGSSHRSHSPPWNPHRSHSPPWNPHRSHRPPWNPHRRHSPPWSPHKSHSPPWSPHRSHSWGRNRLAPRSTRACSSRQAHNSWSHIPHSWSRSPHSQSHSPHSRSHSPHSRSHSLRSSHSSPWFWWIEGGAGRGAGMTAEGAEPTFLKEDVQMTNESLKKFSASFIIKDTQVKTTTRCPLIPQNGHDQKGKNKSCRGSEERELACC
ncbi:CLK4-associating serine/arginine rich protein-like isoform X1 [Pan paniscus]|uniref:CLK4-associating serine/arginine rich protein-like isoform X1 n=1 Tax=Pan paniscus TaxID=9597 RepID=UPI001560DA2C